MTGFAAHGKKESLEKEARRRTVVSIIVPTLNESEQVAAALSPLQAVRRSGHEVILVDGGSEDRTCEMAEPWVDRVEVLPKGRALQMNAGARVAEGGTLLFLHADTRIPPEAMSAFLDGFPSSRRVWGCFDVSLSGRHPMFRVVETMMNVRARLTGIATGDHAMFVHRETFEKVGGYPEIPLMEDIAISRLLRREGRPFFPRGRIVTSSRRWEENGILSTILLMWRLQVAFALGADPHRLAESYRFRSPSAVD